MHSAFRMMREVIHERALAAARRYKSAECELIEVLQLVGEQRVFHYMKYRSLFQYAVEALGLSEPVAYAFIAVARKSSEVPALLEAIKCGETTVTKARVICAVLKPENQERWIPLIKAASLRQIQREVAIASPKNAIRESADYVRMLGLPDVYIELKLGLSEELMIRFRHAQDIVSQSLQRHVSLVESLEVILNTFIRKKDPTAKAKRQMMRGKLDADLKLQCSNIVNVDAASERKPLPSSTRHKVYLKYNGRCAHPNCKERRLLEIHHVIPLSRGGTNDPSNLVLLCRGHHKVQHTH